MAISVRLGTVTDVKAPRKVIAGVFGPPKAGKTHCSLELCPGKRIIPILNDANSLQTCLKVAQMYQDEGLDREIVFMLDDKGAPIQVHLDTSPRVMLDSNACKAYYKKQYLEVLLPLTEYACSQGDSVMTDNVSDMMDVIERANWGTEPVPMREKGARKELLLNYFNMFRVAGVHSVAVLKEQDVWITEKTVQGNTVKTNFTVVGTKPDVFSGAGYIFTDIFQLSRPKPWELQALRDRIRPAIDLYNHRQKVNGLGVKFRALKEGSVVLSLVESQSNNAFNMTNTAWLINPDAAGPDADRLPNGEFRPDAVTLENVWGLIYPKESLDYWYAPVR